MFQGMQGREQEQQNHPVRRDTEGQSSERRTVERVNTQRLTVEPQGPSPI